jgi:hypothetical protein
VKVKTLRWLEVLAPKSKLCYDRASVGQLLLVSDHHLRPVPISLFLSLEMFFRQLLLIVCYYGARSLTRGRVSNLQWLLGLASAVFLGTEFRGTVSNFPHARFQDQGSRALGLKAEILVNKI